ncbi:MAG TPA: response regulator [Steroidobacteraceae bacterium]|nr:response regulator [Steroidobacteraceae bacterium]
MLVVDDDEAVRGSLNLLLKSAGLAARAYASASQFLAAHDDSQPGCLVLDIRMPGMSGLELQDELNRRGAIIPVIFITGHGDVPMAVEAMRRGAMDFLQKPFRDEDLIDRVNKALARDRDNREQLETRDAIRARLSRLTPREMQVLRLLTLGKSNKQMAGDLGVSQRTVEIHRAHLMHKTEASSVAQLVRMFLIAES